MASHIAILMLSLATITLGCSPPLGWVIKPIEERAREADYVVHGTVISDQVSVYPTADPLEFVQAYTVTVAPICWLRQGRAGREERGPLGNITVLQENLCVSNDLAMDREYILFLDRSANHSYTVANVNVQSGAFEEPTAEDFQAVRRGVKAGETGRRRDSDSTDSCSEREDLDVLCFAEDMEEVCGGGAIVSATMWSLVIAASLVVFSN